MVCLAEPIDLFRASWVRIRERKAKTHGNEAWENYLRALGNGFVWSHAVLNAATFPEISTPTRVVSLHDIHTLPIDFVESYYANQGDRLRLRSPYLEHLSQSFARFFMRVALPIEVDAREAKPTDPGAAEGKP